MDLDRMPLLKALEQYTEKSRIPFHMPGHKENIRNFKELALIQENLFKYDKTEVIGLDNLHLPEGAIREAQEMAAEAFHAARSYFLVNGSTCGIYSMITGVTKPGDKIIVQRNCHRSIHMAAFIGELEVKYVNPQLDEDFGIPAGLSVDDVVLMMEENPDATALVLVHPSYYGICSDIETIIYEAHKRNILVLVDEAHGAHFPFGEAMPKPAMLCGADISVTSVHKSLPALTQSSILNLNSSMRSSIFVDRIEFMLRLYQSTSPSYILMASIDAARNIMQSRGRELLSELDDNIEAFKMKMSKLNSFKVLDKAQLGRHGISDLDTTKIVIHSSIGGVKLAQVLEREFNIVVEMADMYNIVLITSIGDTSVQFDKLYEAFEQINSKVPDRTSKIKLDTLPEYKYSCSMRTAFYSKKQKKKIEDSTGFVSAEMVVPYPPGIPVLLPGEQITAELVAYIDKIKKAGIHITGMEDKVAQYIEVIDESITK